MSVQLRVQMSLFPTNYEPSMCANMIHCYKLMCNVLVLVFPQGSQARYSTFFIKSYI